MNTYDVDSTFGGFKLTLFRVRASGTGMLVPRTEMEPGQIEFIRAP